MVAVRRWLVRPVTLLRQATMAVDSGRYDTPVPAVGPAEVADLGRATELMRTRLVTALAEAQQAEAIIASSHDAVVGKSLDQTIMTWNPGIVSQAGGTVRVYSEPGTGTVFTILLPVTGQLEHIDLLLTDVVMPRMPPRRIRCPDAGCVPAACRRADSV